MTCLAQSSIGEREWRHRKFQILDCYVTYVDKLQFPEVLGWALGMHCMERQSDNLLSLLVN